MSTPLPTRNREATPIDVVARTRPISTGATDQSRTLDPAATASVRPSGENAIAVTGAPTARLRRTVALSMSQSRTTPSLEPVATVPPVTENPPPGNVG